jgi:hypothetical protein
MSVGSSPAVIWPRIVGPTAVFDEDSTWSSKNARSSGVIERARATSSASDSADTSGRVARAPSAWALWASSSGQSVADITHPIWAPMRAPASGESSSGWATYGGVSGRLPKNAASMAAAPAPERTPNTRTDEAFT